jgi:hypothetical protein
MSSRRTIAALIFGVVAVVAGGCADAGPAGPPAPASTVPPGWMTFTSDAGDLRVPLPPWMVPFDGTFANEPPMHPGDPFLEMILEGPRTAEPQPRPGDDLGAWLLAKTDLEAFEATPSPVRLPAGPAVSLTRVIPNGTPTPWRVVAFAIASPSGVAFILIDGPANRWEARREELELIPWLVELR